MDRSAARQLVKNTFQNAFDKERFTYFCKELLNRFEAAPLTYRGNLIRHSFKDYIQSLERIGKYKDSDGKRVDILIVKLQKGSSLERARTMQRNFIAWFLSSRGDILKDAALVAFVSPDSADWRFSLVTMEYKLTETPKGKVKAQAEYTPARRFSFLVGEHETSHTAQSSLVPIIEDDAHNPTLKQIEEAFNIEKATKEFFEKYRNLYFGVVDALEELLAKDTDIKKDFDSKGVIVSDFAKKLLGQVVFLYFLQKKGWFGVPKGKTWGEGSKTFLRDLYEGQHCTYNNFFNDVLEHLFYQALREDRTGDVYAPLNCRIPFLNGGLFDPISNYAWFETDILLPNELFSNSTKTKEGDIGTGILDIFDRYNFTVNEDEPLEKEVAVDPEMLGKVFENLLEVKDRKSKGTYYTPREIVHYMCQESLINQLATELDGKASKEELESLVRFGETIKEHDDHTAKLGRETGTYSFKLPVSIRDNAKLIDEKLETIRICDPAVGSGAFPVGMMSEIIRARGALTPHIGESKERTPYNFKRHAIQESLYGVDIDPGAIEIAKLRLWLSLIVDEEERSTIQPLPNLDFKLVCGDSLLSVERKLLNWNQFEKLEELKPMYFSETNSNKKQRLKDDIDKLILEITDGLKVFSFEVYFSEIFHGDKAGFDIVIANPPYVSVEKFTRTAQQKAWKDKFKTYAGRGDIYCFFYEQGLSLLHVGGVLTFISSNKFQRAGYGKKLRELLTSYRIHTLIDFCELPVFAASADPIIVIVSKEDSDAAHRIPALVVKDKSEFSQLPSLVAKRAELYEVAQLNSDGWSLEGVQGLKLVEKISKCGKPLHDYVHGRLLYGVKTGFNEAFIISRAKRDELISKDRKSAEILKPFLRGRDMKRWIVEPQDLWLVATFPALNLDIDDYPAVKEYLESFGRKLEQTGEVIGKDAQGNVIKSRKKTFNKWFETQDNIAYADAFEQPKIVLAEIGKMMKASFDSGNHFIGNKGYIIPNAEPYLLTILISRVVDWYVRMTFQSFGDPWKGGRIQFINRNLITIPVPTASDDDKARLSKLSEQAAKHATAGDEAALAKVEQKIDEIVYQLFGLTDEEVELITDSYS